MIQGLGSFALSLLSVLWLTPHLPESHGSRWLLEAQLSNAYSSPKAGGRENRPRGPGPHSVHLLRSYSRNLSQQIPLVSHGQSCVARPYLVVRAAALLAPLLHSTW